MCYIERKNIDLLVSHFALKRNLGADYMSRAGSVEGLALSTEMTAQPGIT